MAGTCGLACPVTGGFYSYQPSISGNTAFIVIYGLLFLATLFLGRRQGILLYSVLLGVSHLLQILTFTGRVLLHRARDSTPYFLLFLLGTLLAPPFAASTILSIFPSMLTVSARNQPFICRVASLHLGMQGLIALVLGLELAGAVLVCYGQRALQETKSAIIIITGLGVQTISLILFWAIYAVAFYRNSKRTHNHQFYGDNDSPLRKACRGLGPASVAILLHSVYRIVEMALGISGTLFQSETAFMVANGALPLIYCMLLSIFHPKKAAQPPSNLTSATAEKRKERPAPLTHEDDDSTHHRYSPNIALQVSPTSQESHASNPPEVPSGSPGLPANPRPTQKLTTSLNATKVHSSNSPLVPPSGNHHRVGKRGRMVQEMVETDSLW